MSVALADQGDDFSGAALHHGGYDGPAGVYNAEEIGSEGLGPGAGGGVEEGVERAGDGGGADHHIDGSTKDDASAIDGKGKLLGVGDVGADAERISAGLFDFDVSQIDLSFIAADESNPGPSAREAESEAFA